MASSSSFMPRSTYDVFLSFRGEDTRFNFTSHLYKDLISNGILTFRDDEEVERGGAIQSNLSKAIEESKLFVVIFSKNYANSRWCLDELVEIVECMNGNGRTVLPVFYDVDPSNVRNQTGSYEKAFADHEMEADQEKREKIHKWRSALTQVANLGGYHLQNYRYESESIEEIVADILKILNPRLLHVDKNIVGKDSYLTKVKPLLSLHLVDVCMVGICGIGGIGKTTIAKIVYNNILCEFEGSCFLEDIKERFKDRSGRLQLQEEILCSILTRKSLKLNNISEGINMMKEKFCSRKVLLVLDDVDHLHQLELLCGSLEWFGPGSRIIVTTRDKHLLDEVGVDEDNLYVATGLNHMEAIQLFSRHAFKQEVPETDYADLSNSVVQYAEGNPLALKILGSFLFGGTIDEWQSTLKRLKKRLNKDIHNVLKISFDGLIDDRDREIFLDIACFLKGEDTDLISRLYENSDVGIRVLRDRCLISISNNKIHMHDLIQQMGWEIVREEFHREPSKWSRLWDPDDIYQAFSRKETMKKIEVLSMDLSLVEKEIQFDTKVFAKMKRLRLLKVHWSRGIDLEEMKYRVLLPQDFKFPSYELRYLHWDGYSLKSLPPDFNGGNLVELRLKYSNIELLWGGNKLFEKLSVINLSYSKKLTKLPNLSSMPNLEKLILEGCTSLRKVDAALGGLKNLIVLNLSGCRKLKRLPQICKLESLEILDLSYCSKFKKFPEIQGNWEHLKELRLKATAIKELPSSSGYLESLRVLDLEGCKYFEKFPEMEENTSGLRELHFERSGIGELPSIGFLENLRILNLKRCPNLHKFPEMHKNMRYLNEISLDGSGIKELPSSIGNLVSLERLSLSDCSNFDKFPEIRKKMGSVRYLCLNNTAIRELPPSIDNLIRLEHLDLSNCRNLRSLPNSICRLKSLCHLYLSGCSNLESFPEIMEAMGYLEHLVLDGTAIRGLPRSIIKLKQLGFLILDDCKNLVTLPSTIGYLTSLTTLQLRNCPKLDKLPDSLSHLCFLKRLDLSGCNLTEGEIPRYYRLPYSLEDLDLSRNCFHSIPAGIVDLLNLKNLRLSHCKMLQEIPRLPSSLVRIEAHDCPNLFASSTHNCLTSAIEKRWERVDAVFPGSSGIPEWVRHRNAGNGIRVQLPVNWYQDKDLLGFAFFSLYHHQNCEFPRFECELTFRGGEVEYEESFEFWGEFEINCGNALDSGLWLTYYPKVALRLNNHSCEWILEARFISELQYKECGIHLIYAQEDFGNLKRRRDDSPQHQRAKAPKIDLNLSPYSF